MVLAPCLMRGGGKWVQFTITWVDQCKVSTMHRIHKVFMSSRWAQVRRHSHRVNAFEKALQEKAQLLPDLGQPIKI